VPCISFLDENTTHTQIINITTEEHHFACSIVYKAISKTGSLGSCSVGIVGSSKRLAICKNPRSLLCWNQDRTKVALSSQLFRQQQALTSTRFRCFTGFYIGVKVRRLSFLLSFPCLTFSYTFCPSSHQPSCPPYFLLFLPACLSCSLFIYQLLVHFSLVVGSLLSPLDLCNTPTLKPLKDFGLDS